MICLGYLFMAKCARFFSCVSYCYSYMKHKNKRIFRIFVLSTYKNSYTLGVYVHLLYQVPCVTEFKILTNTYMVDLINAIRLILIRNTNTYRKWNKPLFPDPLPVCGASQKLPASLAFCEILRRMESETCQYLCF